MRCQCTTSQKHKRRRKPRPDRSLPLPLPNSFSPRQWYWRYPISRLVLTHSEVRSCYTPRPTWGSACSGGVTLASLFWRTCSSSSHRIAGYYRSRECAEASQTVLPSSPSNRPFVVVIACEDLCWSVSSEDGFIIPCFLFRVGGNGKNVFKLTRTHSS